MNTSYAGDLQAKYRWTREQLTIEATHQGQSATGVFGDEDLLSSSCPL